ncbi:hypothetical protein KBI33_04250 [Candidatus Shapirobacteria bacterium]|nr:hypothetical protein [Candidatus Shapirobacteria bacterium]
MGVFCQVLASFILNISAILRNELARDPSWEGISPRRFYGQILDCWQVISP